MRSNGTWVALFFIAATLLVALVFQLALQELFHFARIEDKAILGPRLTFTTLIALILSAASAIYTAFLNQKSRMFVEQCIQELDKCAWPTPSDTKSSTITVVVTSFVAAIILGFFDTVFGWLTNHQLFLG